MKKFILGFFTVLFSVSQAFAQLGAAVSRTTVPEGDAFQLSVRLDDKGATPDFSALEKDFIIAGRRNSYKSTYINGKSESYSEIILTLYPRKTGKLTIPPIRAGKQETKPVEITVVAGDQPMPAGTSGQAGERNRSRIFLRAEIDNQRPYVGQQAVYTVRLYSSLPLLDGGIVPPSSDDASVIPLERPKQARSVVDGRPFYVFESKFAVFANKSGEIVLNPAVFQGVVSDPDGGGKDDDPFSGMFGGLMLPDLFAQKNVAVRSGSVTLHVRPQPDGTGGEGWLPATDVSVSENVTPPQTEVTAGEAVTRTVTVSVGGQSENRVPDPSFPDGTGYKQYPGKTDSKNLVDANGLVGVKTRQIVFIPTHTGEVVLPALKIGWFDTKSNMMKTAELPSRVVIVKPSPDAQTPSTAAPSASVSENRREPSGAGAKPEMLSFVREGKMQEGREMPEVGDVVVLPAKFGTFSPETLLGIGAVSGGALVGLFWVMSVLLRRAGKRAEKQKSEESSKRKAVAAFKKACSDGDPAAAKEALIRLAHVLWPSRPPLTLSDVAAKFADDDFFVQLENLNEALYAKEKREWNGKSLWRAFAATVQYKNASERDETPPVPPLYPKG